MNVQRFAIAGRALTDICCIAVGILKKTEMPNCVLGGVRKGCLSNSLALKHYTISLLTEELSVHLTS